MNIKEIKKGDKILHSHLGAQPPVSGIVKESPIIGRGIRSTLLVDVKGSEVGLFDEIGSIYTNQILKVFRDDNWLPVEHGESKPFKNALGIDQIHQDLSK